MLIRLRNRIRHIRIRLSRPLRRLDAYDGVAFTSAPLVIDLRTKGPDRRQSERRRSALV